MQGRKLVCPLEHQSENAAPSGRTGNYHPNITSSKENTTVHKGKYTIKKKTFHDKRHSIGC